MDNPHYAGIYDEALTSKRIQTVVEKKTFKKTIEYDTDKTFTKDTEVVSKKYVDDTITNASDSIIASATDVSLTSSALTTVLTIPANTLEPDTHYEVFFVSTGVATSSSIAGIQLYDPVTGFGASNGEMYAKTADGSTFDEFIAVFNFRTLTNGKVKFINGEAYPCGSNKTTASVNPTFSSAYIVSNGCEVKVYNSDSTTRTVKFVYLKKL